MWFYVAFFGVRNSVAFHFMCDHIIFSLVWVAECPSFRKELLTRLIICSICILNICHFRYFPFWFLRRFLVVAYL